MEEFKGIARAHKALGDENRLKIMEYLKKGEQSACELLDKLQIRQSTLSHHMKILMEARIVEGRRDGKWMYYSLDKNGIMIIQRSLLDYALAKKEDKD